MVKYRIAVCMYGQPRTALHCVDWIKRQYTFTEPKFWVLQKMRGRNIEFLPEAVDVEVDYFLHLKDYNTYNNALADANKLYRVPDEELHQIINAYNPKRFRITRYEEDQALTKWPNWYYSSLFKSIAFTVNLKKQEEVERSITYDLVALQRYDVIVGPQVNQLQNALTHQCIHPLSIMPTSGKYRMWGEAWQLAVNDMYIIGDSLGIDALVSSCHSSWQNTREEYIDDWMMYGPNVYMVRNAESSGVLINHVHHCVPALVRPESDLTLPILDNFAYHSNFWLTNHAGMKT